jgi:cardiolipin synthase
MVWRRKIGIFPWHFNKDIQLLQSGESFFNELLFLIRSAKISIYFQVYIFDGDETGKVVYEELLAAAKRGVNVYLHLDAFGSKEFPPIWELSLKQNGAKIEFFSRFKFAFRYHIGMRLHHKIIIIDEKISLVGGINISDNYSHLGKQKTWLDFAIQMEGNTVKDLLKICIQIENGFSPLSKFDKEKLIYNNPIGLVKARVLQNYWLFAKFGISRQYRQNIRKAREEILIITSYFVPSPALKRLLKKAAKRGVKVRLVLGSISDVGIVKHASHFFYGDLLKSGVEIWEWQPSVLHAKLAFVDHQWMCIGSYNLNYLSDFGSTECNIEILDKPFQQKCLNQINTLLKNDAVKIDATAYLNESNVFIKIRNFLSYHILSISLKILFYFQKQK